jgi:hypothetical protein
MINGADTPLEIVVFDANHQWDQLLSSASGYLDIATLERLKLLLNTSTQTVMVERYYIDRDYRDTFSNYHSKRFSTPPSRCIRLHFFNRVVTRAELLDPSGIQKAYLGYAVIRPTRPSSLGRTLIDPRKIPHVEGTACLSTEKVSIQGSDLEVTGFPFISQDSDVTVCAQSAMWMLFRYYSNFLRTSKEVYPHQIGTLVSDYSIGRLFPSSGLTLWQMGEACRKMGHPALIYSRRKFEDEGLGIPFEHLIYTYIESGLPVILGLPGHAIISYGHKSDYTKAAPVRPTGPVTPAPFAFSSHYNDALVISDDNTVPYQLLADGTSLDPTASGYKQSEIDSFLVALPEKVFLSAEHFQTAVTTLLNDSTFGYQTVSARLRGEYLMLRLFLTDGNSFKRSLLQRPMGNPTVADIYRNLPLPHFIWICEISTPALFAKHEILGEVLWDATRNVYEPDGWLALHYPEKIIYDQGTCFNEEQDLLERDLVDGVAYPLYRNNLKDLT